MQSSYFPLLLLLFLSLRNASALVVLRTSTKVRGYSQKQVQNFLATSANWPDIVLSSWSVQGSTIDAPLKRSDQVDETFGLPPLLPLTVSWRCVASDPSVLDVISPEGVAGLARNCRMRFDILQEQEEEVTVDLTMEYEPENILGQMAIPILSLDNALAIKLLFPNAIRRALHPAAPLEEFLQLMGSLYGFAGVAHLLDCLYFDSKLLVAAGSPPFAALPVEAQALALLWCAVGPLSFVLSSTGLGTAGLVLYGAVEVFCAAVLVHFTNLGSAELDPLTNAIVVQAVVFASWLYSSQRKTNEESSG
jgi:hypothetical protein